MCPESCRNSWSGYDTIRFASYCECAPCTGAGFFFTRERAVLCAHYDYPLSTMPSATTLHETSSSARLHHVPQAPVLQYPEEDFNATIAFLASVRARACSSNEHRDEHGHKSHMIEPPVASQWAVVTGGSGYQESAHGPAVVNQRCYCAWQGIHFHHVSHDFTKGAKDVHVMYNKMFSVVHALASLPPGAWALWSDRDVIFNNMSVSLADSVEDAMRNSPTPEACNIITDPRFGAGVVLFKNTCWTLKFISAWFHRRLNPPDCQFVHPQYDQIPFLLTLLDESIAHDPGLHANITYALPGSRSGVQNGSVLYPDCRQWAGGLRIVHQLAWGGPSSRLVHAASHKPGSRVCILPQTGWRQLRHFAGMKTHSSVRSCFRQNTQQWGSISEPNLTRFCRRYAYESARVPAAAQVATCGKVNVNMTGNFLAQETGM